MLHLEELCLWLPWAYNLPRYDAREFAPRLKLGECVHDAVLDFLVREHL